MSILCLNTSCGARRRLIGGLVRREHLVSLSVHVTSWQRGSGGHALPIYITTLPLSTGFRNTARNSVMDRTGEYGH